MRPRASTAFALGAFLMAALMLSPGLPANAPVVTADQSHEPLIINSSRTLVGDFTINSTDTVILENSTLRIKDGKVRVYGLLRITNATLFVDSFESWRTYNGLEVFARGAMYARHTVLFTSTVIHENAVIDLFEADSLNLRASDGAVLRWERGLTNGSITLEDLSVGMLTSVAAREDILGRTDARLTLTDTSSASLSLGDESVATLSSVVSTTMTLGDAARATVSDSQFESVSLTGSAYADFKNSSMKRLVFLNNSVVWVNDSTVGTAQGADFALFVPVNSHVGSLTYIRTKSELPADIALAALASAVLIVRRKSIRRHGQRLADGAVT